MLLHKECVHLENMFTETHVTPAHPSDENQATAIGEVHQKCHSELAIIKQ